MAEAEDLNFFGRVRAGGDLADVIQFAPLRRAHVAERIAQRVEVRFAEERGHQGDGQQHDQPRRVNDQARGEGHDRDDVLGLAE